MSGEPFGDPRNRLEPGERILWQGRPNARRFVLGGSILIIPLTALWFAFALFWEYTAIAARAPAVFLVGGGIFVAFGLYITAGRFLVARREAARTSYVLTDRRLQMHTGAFGSHYQEIALRSMPAPVLDEREDGVGTITFGMALPYRGFIGAGWPGAGRTTPAFVAIEDSQRVFRMIDEARAQAIADSDRR